MVIMYIPGDLVGLHRSLSSGKGLLSKLLDICLTGRVVNYGIVICALGLGRLQALNQCFCVGEAIVVGGMETFGNDLVNGMVLAWTRR
jgi:hypothetical protein